MTKVGLHAIGKSTTLESNRSLRPLRDYKSIETHGRIGTPQALYKSETSVGVPVRSLWIARLRPHPLHRCLQFGLKGAVALELLAYIA